MATSILYFGPDEWKRIPVIENAGYVVRECHRIEDLESAIRQPPPPQAVLINSSGHGSLKPALQLIRTAALAPVIVFPSPEDSSLDTPVDLVVPPLTPPSEWLRELAALIERAARFTSC